MNTKASTETLLNGLLDGTLDAAQESAALELLAADAQAREQFAGMAQLHLWLASDPQVRQSLAAWPAGAGRRVISRRTWWLAAAAAALVTGLLMLKLRPADDGLAGEPEARTETPLLAAVCRNCHTDAGALLHAAGSRVYPEASPVEAARQILRSRLADGSPCAEGLDVAERGRVLLWQ